MSLRNFRIILNSSCALTCNFKQKLQSNLRLNYVNNIQMKNLPLRKFCSSLTCSPGKKEEPDPCIPIHNIGLVIGLYTNEEDRDDQGKLTPSGEKYNLRVCNKITELLKYAGYPPKKGEIRIFYNLEKYITYVAVVGLGKQCQGYNVYEKMDEGKETIRIAAGVGCKALQELRAIKIYVESFGHAESAAEGAALSIWLYQEHKNKSEQLLSPQLELYDDCDHLGWEIGLQKAAAQNLARQLTDTPSNMMTPIIFSQCCVDILCKTGINVEVKVNHWAEGQKMFAFLAAGKGSCEPPIFLELSYYGAHKDERPIVLIGKGTTYNSGGICLKSCKHQEHMRGDMTGAACVVAAIRAAANLQLPLNIRALIPLCENMPGCAAMRPGDIVTAMNGKSIKIVSTDACGLLCLADALCYSKYCWPRFILDVGSLSLGIANAFGVASCGVFTNSEALWEYMLAASMHTGDRVWRLPLWKHYTELIKQSDCVDVKTIGHGRKPEQYGEPCEVAAFLNEFVPCGDWIHLDTYGVLWSNGQDYPYLREGMSGRPIRTVVEFLCQLICNKE